VKGDYAVESVIATLIVLVVGFQTSTGWAHWVNNHSAAWPIAEILHFMGLCLLIGTVGLLDLRLLGMGKALPVAPLERLIPWGVSGFVICLVTGTMFVTGNAFAPGEYLQNIAFLWKIVFILLAGINVLVFYLTGLARAVDALGPGEDAPPAAKVIAAMSLFLWIGVIYFGRMLPVLGDAF